MKLFSIILALIFLLFFPFGFVQLCVFIYLIITGISFIYSRLVYYGIYVSRKESVIRAYKYQSFDVTLYVKNNCIFPVYYITISDNYNTLYYLKKGKYLVTLNRGEKRKLLISIDGHQRGEVLIGPIVVRFSDPLGLFPWEKVIESYCKVIIYPSIYPVRRCINNGLPGGAIHVNDKIYEDLTNFRSMREYISGDDIRKINWKVSARLGSLHTMQFISTLKSPVIILLNLTLNAYPSKKKYHLIERAIETSASLVSYYTDKNQEIGFLSTGLIDNIHPSIGIHAGHSHAVLLLEILARINPSCEDIDVIDYFNDSGVRIPIPNRTRIIVVSPRLSERQLNILAIIRKQNIFIETFQIGERKNDCTAPGIKNFFVRSYGNELLYE